MAIYSLRQTEYGREYIVTVARIDIGSIWQERGEWHITRYGYRDVDLPETFSRADDAVDFLIRNPER
jgi:hypothetical protein